MWWLQQSDEARSAFKQKGVSMRKALQDFNEYIDAIGNRDEIRIWGNGSDFDNVILTSAYRHCASAAPAIANADAGKPRR